MLAVLSMGFMMLFPLRKFWRQGVIGAGILWLVFSAVSNRNVLELMANSGFDAGSSWYRVGLNKYTLSGGGMSGHWLAGYGDIPGEYNHFHDLCIHWVFLCVYNGLMGVVGFYTLVGTCAWQLWNGKKRAHGMADEWVLWTLLSALAGAGIVAYGLLWIFTPGGGDDARPSGTERRQAIGLALLGMGLSVAVSWAFSGTVAAVEMAYSEGRRPMPRPLVTVITADFPQAEAGARAYRALPDAKSAQTAELVAVAPSRPLPGPRSGPDEEAPEAAKETGPPDAPGTPPAAERSAAERSAAVPAERSAPGAPEPPASESSASGAPPRWAVTVRLTGGMGSARTPREGSVPEPGEQVTFTLFAHDPRSGPALPEPEATPWTHGGPPGAGKAAQPEAPDTVTSEDFL